MKLDYEMGEQEPWWVTVIAVILFFLIWGIFVLPRELEKKRKEYTSPSTRDGLLSRMPSSEGKKKINKQKTS